MTINGAPPRADVQARFPDGRAFNGPAGSMVSSFVEAWKPEEQDEIVAVLVDGKLKELCYQMYRDAQITPITTKDSDGARIYRRTLSFLLVVAARELFPQLQIMIEHSMPFGGYYCQSFAADGSMYNLEEAELKALEGRMRDLVEADLPIKQSKVPLEEALVIFRNSGESEKEALFKRRRKDYLTLYELNGIRDYFHGFMVPRTRYLKRFTLHPYADGFIFQFPRRHAHEVLQPFVDEPRLARVFRDYNDWLRVFDVSDVASLNRAIRTNRAQEIVLVAEALHRHQLTQIAMQIAERRDEIKVVLISGPTSAGKTTFSKRLAVQLLALGMKPVAIPMDNYFVDRDLTPRDEKGDFDFEALEAVDVPLFQQHLHQLLAGEAITQPIYDFHTGQRRWGASLRIEQEHVLIIEGIHGLNPRLVEGIATNALYRVFISAFTQLNLDRHSRVPTTDTRLLRRMVRDAAHRGYTASDTIKRWPSVRRGEKNHIFPYQNNANVFFNSALVYELAALKPLAQPLLLQVEPGTPERIEANRLLAFLQWFEPFPAMEAVNIPSDSIVREFIGGSILESFEPWR
ncbi:MAG TPA: nucleoside kinase [Anaerolineae bacterium]|nr:nucleoside kinase [Anaerolineae bacterium]